MINFLGRRFWELLARKSAYLEKQNLPPTRRDTVLEGIRCFMAMMLRRLRQHSADQLFNISFYVEEGASERLGATSGEAEAHSIVT